MIRQEIENEIANFEESSKVLVKAVLRDMYDECSPAVLAWLRTLTDHQRRVLVSGETESSKITEQYILLGIRSVVMRIRIKSNNQANQLMKTLFADLLKIVAKVGLAMLEAWLEKQGGKL